MSAFCGSSTLPASAFPFAATLDALRLGAPDTYDDFARSWPLPRKVARESIKNAKIRFVYFMPSESNFFTLNPVSSHSQPIRCTQGAEIGGSLQRYVIDFRGAPQGCQVTKGALVWSWHKTCNLNDLRRPTRSTGGRRKPLVNWMQGVT